MIIRVSEIRQLCCGSREDEDSLNGAASEALVVLNE